MLQSWYMIVCIDTDIFQKTEKKSALTYTAGTVLLLCTSANQYKLIKLVCTGTAILA